MNHPSSGASRPDTGTVHLRADDTLMIPVAADRWGELLLALADAAVPTVPGDTGAMRAVAKLDEQAYTAVLRWIRSANHAHHTRHAQHAQHTQHARQADPAERPDR
ncbi:hypothetical protein [Peterkaempfera bronchialis]|uniref:hypothetical protein n=1 Tax=Peterkaempfera bronchialis TaxID=2126346 RepID=UPI003C2BBFA0